MSSNLSRGLQSKIDATALEDGKLRFAIDTGRLFMDTASERIEFTDVVKGLKYSEIIALENPLPKVYLSSDSHQILSYDYKEEEWILYGGGVAPSFYVVDLYYNDEGNTVLVYGNGDEKVVENPHLSERIEELEKTVNKFASTIEILQNQISSQS